MASLRLRLAPRMAEVARLADEAGRFAEAAGLGADMVARLLTVLDELVTNVVMHGRLAEHDSIEVQLAVRDAGLDVLVLDPGPPFDPLRDAPAPQLDGQVEQRPIGGLGVHLVQQLSRDLRYARTPEGCNRLGFRIE